MDTLIPILRGLLGMAAFTAVAYAFSAHRRSIDWKLVRTGMLLQVIVAIVVIKVGPVRAVFAMIGRFFVKVIDFTSAGTGLLFGWFNDLAGGNVDGLAFTQGGPVFVVTILPTIIFFAALTALLYYLGILQRVVYVFAWALSKTMKLSGAETMSASANVFIGQTEAPLLIKPYLERMTRSELLAIMCGGMATIAGGVMAVYIVLLGGDDPAARIQFATHLLTKSVISAPCALVIAKILLPQEDRIDARIDIPRERFGVNLLDAICTGTTDGVKLAVNVGAMLIVFTALVAMINFGLGDLFGQWSGLNGLVATMTGGEHEQFSLQFIFGVIGAPVAWLMGIDSGHLMVAGSLLGEKVVLNEFVAYFSMNTLQASGELTDERTRIILTYALCGFSNLVSIGIQIGGIGALAPGQRQELARLGWRALLGGSLACFIPACIAGMLI